MAETLKWFEDPAALRRTRKHLGLTQADLANKAGVKRSLIANIEAGRRRLSEDIQDRIWDPLTAIEMERRTASGSIPLAWLGASATRLASLGQSQSSMSLAKLGQSTEPQDPLQAAQKRIATLEGLVKSYKSLHESDKELIQSQEERIQSSDEIIEVYAEWVKEVLGENADLDEGLEKVRNLEKSVSDLQKTVQEKDAHIKELRDQLGLDIEAAVAQQKADEHREKIKKPVTAPEGGE